MRLWRLVDGVAVSAISFVGRKWNSTILYKKRMAEMIHLRIVSLYALNAMPTWGKEIHTTPREKAILPRNCVCIVTIGTIESRHRCPQKYQIVTNNYSTISVRFFNH